MKSACFLGQRLKTWSVAPHRMHHSLSHDGCTPGFLGLCCLLPLLLSLELDLLRGLPWPLPRALRRGEGVPRPLDCPLGAVDLAIMHICASSSCSSVSMIMSLLMGLSLFAGFLLDVFTYFLASDSSKTL